VNKGSGSAELREYRRRGESRQGEITMSEKKKEWQITKRGYNVYEVLSALQAERSATNANVESRNQDDGSDQKETR